MKNIEVGNLEFVYTNGSNQDFILLCHELDTFLNELAGGEENRSQYFPYNQLNDIDNAIVVYDEGVPVGCASFKKYDTEYAEVKRVFIRKEYRGKGLSKRLMVLLEKSAKEKGYTHLILETGEPLVAAMRLYYSLGFQVIPNYGQYKEMSESICMKKDL